MYTQAQMRSLRLVEALRNRDKIEFSDLAKKCYLSDLIGMPRRRRGKRHYSKYDRIM